MKIFVTLTSGCFLSVAGFYLLLNKKFKKHPYPMIGMACLFQAAYFFSYFDIFSICEYGLIEGLGYNLGLWKMMSSQGIIEGFSAWSNYGKWKEEYFTPEDSYRIFVNYIISWKVKVITLTYLHLCSNSILFIDLFLTLKNPFYPRQKRVIKYKIFLFIVFIFSVSNIWISIRNNNTSINLYDNVRQDQAIKIFLIYTYVMISTTFIPTVLVIFRLCKRGTSRELRQKVIKRHISFFIVYLICLVQVLED